LQPAEALAVLERGTGAIHAFINHNLAGSAAAENDLFTAGAAFSPAIQWRGGVAHEQYSVSS
jgi:hypothetical protein